VVRWGTAVERRAHFTWAWRYADEVREGEVDDLQAGGEELVEECNKGCVRKWREARKGKRYH